MSISRTYEISKLEALNALQNFIANQYTQVFLVLREFFEKQEQFHTELIGEKIDTAFKKLFSLISFSLIESQALCYYQCLFFEIKGVLSQNPFLTPEPFKAEYFKLNTLDPLQFTNNVQDIYRVCTSAQLDSIFLACAKDQAEIYAPCTLFLKALVIKYHSDDIINAANTLSSALIALQQHLARYALLMEAVRKPLQEIIDKADQANIEQELYDKQTQEIQLDTIKRQREVALCDLTVVQKILDHLKFKLFDYNKKIQSTLKEDLLTKLLVELNAEKQRLKVYLSTDKHKKKLALIDTILEIIAENIINHKTVKELVEDIRKLITAYDDMLKKPRKYIVLPLFKPTASLLKILEGFISTVQLQPFFCESIIPDPYTPSLHTVEKKLEMQESNDESDKHVSR